MILDSRLSVVCSTAPLGYSWFDLDRPTAHFMSIKLTHGPAGFIKCFEINKAVRWVSSTEWIDGYVQVNDGKAVLEELFDILRLDRVE